MSDGPPTEDGDRTLSLGGRLEDVCDRAEAAWKAGRPLRIEDFLGEAAEADRAELFRACSCWSWPTAAAAASSRRWKNTSPDSRNTPA